MDTLVTTSHQGRIHVWDLRSGESPCKMGHPASRSPLMCSASNPAKPHVCVAGASDGRFSEWDFRNPALPVFSEVVDGGIRAITYENKGSTVERLRFCTASGKIYKVVNQQCHLIYEEPHGGFQSMCVSSSATLSHVFASTNQEGLVYISNSMKYF